MRAKAEELSQGSAEFFFWHKKRQKISEKPYQQVAINSNKMQCIAVYNNVWHIPIDVTVLINMKKSLILKAFSYAWQKNGRKLA